MFITKRALFVLFLVAWRTTGLLAQELLLCNDDCTNNRNNWMEENGIECIDILTTFSWAINNGCKYNEHWVKNKYCEQTCEEVGSGYDGASICCPPPSSTNDCKVCSDNPNGYMTTNNIKCSDIPNTFSWAVNHGCKYHEDWVKNKYCEQTCQEVGSGYGDSVCCPSSDTLGGSPTISPASRPTPRPTQRSTTTRSTLRPTPRPTNSPPTPPLTPRPTSRPTPSSSLQICEGFHKEIYAHYNFGAGHTVNLLLDFPKSIQFESSSDGTDDDNNTRTMNTKIISIYDNESGFVSACKERPNDTASCEINCNGQIRAVNQDCAAPVIYGNYVSTGCSYASYFDPNANSSYVVTCCIVDDDDGVRNSC